MLFYKWQKSNEMTVMVALETQYQHGSHVYCRIYWDVWILAWRYYNLTPYFFQPKTKYSLVSDCNKVCFNHQTLAKFKTKKLSVLSEQVHWGKLLIRFWAGWGFFFPYWFFCNYFWTTQRFCFKLPDFVQNLISNIF